MKKMNKKGFTLMEMLIVIAIIAILIAIAIPTFTSALDKAKQKTDLANVRALKSLVAADFMLNDGTSVTNGTTVTWTGTGDTATATFYLNAQGDTILLSDTGACKVTANKWDNKGDPISVTINKTGKITATVPDIMAEIAS